MVGKKDASTTATPLISKSSIGSSEIRPSPPPSYPINLITHTVFLSLIPWHPVHHTSDKTRPREIRHPARSVLAGVKKRESAPDTMAMTSSWSERQIKIFVSSNDCVGGRVDLWRIVREDMHAGYFWIWISILREAKSFRGDAMRWCVDDFPPRWEKAGFKVGRCDA